MSKQKEKPARPLVIELRRDLRMHRYHVLGEIGFSHRRDEIRAIMQLGVERGGRLGARDITEHLLGGRTAAVGLRLLRLCQELGLVQWETSTRDRIATLTDDGREVAETGDVFVPERGTWDIWLTDDPLVPHEERLLCVEPFVEPRAQDDIYPKGDRDKREVEQLPDWVFDACDVHGVPHFGDGRAVSNIELSEKAEPAEPDAHVSLTLRLAPDAAPVLVLRGHVAERQNKYELAEFAAPSFEEVWRACLGARASSWDGQSLGVSFNELNDDERRSFLRTMRFSGFTHREHGRFDAFEVQGVPLRPQSDEDASAWAHWLLRDGTHGYVHPTDYQRRCAEKRERFKGYRLTLMTQAELADSIRNSEHERPSRTYWHLKAPLDWGF